MHTRRRMSHKLAVVIPYRDREEHLSLFIPHTHKFLTDAGIDHSIIVVEQEVGKSFNRGKLKNIGFDLGKSDHDYFALHDVDMLPSNVDYSYPKNPTHLASKVGDRTDILYSNFFGGVVLFNKEDYIATNGYSNEYWGWGAEDDDFSWRVIASGLTRENRPGEYLDLAHEKKVYREEYFNNIRKLKSFDGINFKTDGVNTLVYQVLETTELQHCAKKYKVSL